MVAEVTTFVAVMKTLGIETGRVIESLFVVFVVLCFVLYLVSKYAWPKFKDFLSNIDQMKTSVSDLNKSLQEHIVQTDLRLQEGTENFDLLRQDIKKINNRLNQLEKKEIV